MIKIKRRAYSQLIHKVIPEQCGFVAGKEVLEAVYDVDNVNRIKNKFKMGFVSKLKAIFKIMFKRYKQIVIFHVHEYNWYMSEEDLTNALTEMIYLIIYKNQLYFYEIEKIGKLIVSNAIDYKIEGE